jgi:hypothetical protein
VGCPAGRLAHGGKDSELAGRIVIRGLTGYRTDRGLTGRIVGWQNGGLARHTLTRRLTRRLTGTQEGGRAVGRAVG